MAFPGTVSALTVVNNLAGDPSTLVANGELTVVLGSSPSAASSFRTGGTDVMLDSVEVNLRADTPSGGTFLVRVLNDNSGRPGATVVADLGTKALTQSTTLSLESFAAASEALAANTTFWLEVRLTLGGSSRVQLRKDGSSSGVGSFPGFGVSLDNDAPVAVGTDVFMHVQATSASVSAPEINVSDGSATTDPSIADGGSANSFGSFVANSGNTTRTFNIDNISGTSDLSVMGVASSGGNAADFTVSGISLPAIVASGASATFTVNFAPLGTGPRTTTLQIASNDADENPYDITLSGVGTNPTEPEIAFFDGASEIMDGGGASSFSSAVVASGGTSSKTFTVSNAAGTTALTIPSGGITFAGGESGDFSVDEITLPASIAAGSSTTFDVIFTPAAIGSRATTMSIANNDLSENPFTVSLSGAGVGASGVTIVDNLAGTASSLVPAGEFTVTTASPQITSAFATDSNLHTLSSVQLRLRAVTPSGGTFHVRIHPDTGAGAPDFGTLTADLGTIALSQSSTLSTETFSGSGELLQPSTTYWVDVTLEAGASSRVHLHAGEFNSPSATGTFPGLGISQNSGTPGNAPIEIFMLVNGTVGSAIAPEINVNDGPTIADTDIPDGGSAATFGGVIETGAITATRMLSIDNAAGSSDLTIPAGGITFTGGNDGDFAVSNITLPATIPAGGVTAFDIVFDPSGVGARTTTLQIASNDADENPYAISLSGTGLPATSPEINLSDGATAADPDIADGGSASSFGSEVAVGAATLSKTFTIDNAVGSEDLVIPVGGITFIGASAADFSFSAITLPATLASGESVTFEVAFDPTEVGFRSATLQVASNDIDENPYDVTLSGIGLGTDTVTIVDNTAGDPSPLATDGEITLTTASSRVASAFTTDINTHTLTSVDLRLRATTPSGGTFRVRLHPDNGSGAPDFATTTADLGTVVLANSLNLSTQTFSAGGEILDGNSTYWIEVTLEAGASSRVQLHEGGTNDPAATGTLPGSGISLNGSAPADGPNEIFMVVKGTTDPLLPPVAGADVIERNAFTSVKIPVADLLINDSSPSGSNPLTISAVSLTGANGAVLSLSGDTVFYDPFGHVGSDTFEYTLEDSVGLTTTGSVSINIAVDNTASNNLVSLTMMPDGSVATVFAGIPGRTYSIQTSEDLVTWTIRASVEAGADGNLTYTDPPIPPSSRFYRTVQTVVSPAN